MTAIRERRSEPENFVYYDTATGVIAQVVRIPPELAQANLQEGQAVLRVPEGHEVDPDAVKVSDGALVPYEKPVDVELELRKLRAERDRRLAACDWTQVADAPVDAEAWKNYRQALRDLPTHANAFGQVGAWPKPPE